jgi:predicted metal-binding membrane protein
MATMMLPGLTPTVWQHARGGGRVADVLLFVASYLAVCGLFGVPVYVAYRPHGTLVAGLITIAAGLYELTPLKQSFRRHCCDAGHSGLAFGLCCLGSSVGLMLMQVALGIMSVAWMAVASLIIVGQKLLPPRTAIDVPVALAIVAMGGLIVAAPTWVPGLMPAM